jgi:hypothetical protein
MAIEETEEGILSGSYRIYSVSQIETIDLLSEGAIDGIVTKDYTYSGNVGETGWAEVTAGDSYNFLRSVYWNEVPVMDTSNNLNFQQVLVKNTNGEANGEVDELDKLKEETSKTRNISERLRGPTWIDGAPAAPNDEFAKTYRVLNKDCSKIHINIKVSSLSMTDRTPGSEGDIKDHTVEIFVQYRPLTSTPNKVAAFIDHGNVRIHGKVSSAFVHKETVKLISNWSDDEDFVGWEIKVFRTLPEPTTLDVRDATFLDSITEFYQSKFSYPNSATVAQRFNAEYFSSIPERAFDTKGMKVKIPSNYDPIKKTYSSYWDGKFSDETAGPYGEAGVYFTDNPAWCFYDLLTSKRYGLGKYIDNSTVDKWNLYEIGKYCDVMVSDGFGGVEPRFTCNLYIQTREDAFKLVNDMASIFRGITYYAGGNIFSVQDSEKKSLYTFNNANVKDGDFNYSNSSKRVRHTVAVVRYNDKFNFYSPAIEYIEDVDGIRKHGIREVEMTAFGCTSRGQAIRLGRWALFTENMETESISFTAGTEGGYLKPGDVFTVFDANRNTNRWAGRCKMIDITSSKASIVLDQDVMPIMITDREYKLTLLTPTYNYDPSQVTDLDSRDYEDIRRNQTQSYLLTGSRVGNNSIKSMGASAVNTGEYPDLSGLCRVELHSGFNNTDYNINKDTIWTIEPTSEVYTASELEEGIIPDNKYRAIRIEEIEDSTQFNVAGIEYSEAKYSAIESGLSFDDSRALIVPNQPTGIFPLTLKSVTKYTSLIEYTVNPPVNNNGLATLFTYAKPADKWIKKDFVGNYPHFNNQNLNDQVTDSTLVPDGKWRISVRRPQDFPAHYLPTGGGNYIFRAFSANVAGTHSNGSAAASINVPNVDPLKDVKIKNLRESDDPVTVNEAGSMQLHSNDKTDNEYRWNTSVASNQINLNNYNYRITVRDPGNHSTIWDQYTGYQPGGNLYASKTTDSVAWRYDFTGNAATSAGPKRKYMVRVEAHDDKGNSSAGGSFSPTKDSSYTNKDGYDHYTIDNPKIDAPKLQNLADNTNDRVVVEGSLTLDKEVKLVFRRNTYTDVAGVFVYVSKSPFSTNDVKGKTRSQINTNIEVVELKPYSNPIVYTPQDYDIRNADELYVAYSLYDDWDAVRESNDTSYSLIADQYVSNVERLKKGTQIVDAVGDGFKIWLRINLDGKWIGQGIDRIEAIDMSKSKHAGVELPDRYKNYDGFQQYSCWHQNMYVWWDLGSVYGAAYAGYKINLYSKGTDFQYPASNGMCESFNADGTCAEAKVVDYFANYYCGYIDPAEGYADHWRRGGKTKSVATSATDGGEKLRATSEKEGFKRFRVFLDSKTMPETENYAVLGVNINSQDYINPVDQPEAGGGYYYPWQSIWAMNRHKNDTTHAYYGDNPALWKHHPAGFGQGFANLEKKQNYFDIHMGHMIDMSYLREGFFGIITKDKDLDQYGNAIS